MATTPVERPSAPVRVEIWSDIVCPWCYIGKRRFETALAEFEHRDDVDVAWRSFELDPKAPKEAGGNLAERLAAKFGVSLEQARAMNRRTTRVAAGEGLPYRLDIARPGNTFDAHRLLHLAATRGVQGVLKERLLRAYFLEGEAIGDAATLDRLAVDAGMDQTEVRNLLAGDAQAEAVRADQRTAASLGITAVPFFVVDRRYGISGAQGADVILETLRRAWTEAHPLVAVGPGAGTTVCSDDSCAL